MRLWDLLIIVAFGLMSLGAYMLAEWVGYIVGGAVVGVLWFLFDEVKKGSG